MTPNQALQLINNVVAQVSATRQEHISLSEAIETLKIAITPTSEPEED